MPVYLLKIFITSIFHCYIVHLEKNKTEKLYIHNSIPTVDPEEAKNTLGSMIQFAPVIFSGDCCNEDRKGKEIQIVTSITGTADKGKSTCGETCSGDS